jgi:hypothetical protein
MAKIVFTIEDTPNGAVVTCDYAEEFEADDNLTDAEDIARKIQDFLDEEAITANGQQFDA